MWCPERSCRPLKIRARQYNFRGRPYPYPHQVSKVNSLWHLNNVGKGSRQTGSVTSGKGLALGAESDGLESETCRSSWRLVFLLPGAAMYWAGGFTGLRPGRSWAASAYSVALFAAAWGNLRRAVSLLPSSGARRLTQNWHGPGESDCLIKTKHCDVR